VIFIAFGIFYVSGIFEMQKREIVLQRQQAVDARRRTVAGSTDAATKNHDVVSEDNKRRVKAAQTTRKVGKRPRR
jgi:hypothetical protein